MPRPVPRAALLALALAAPVAAQQTSGEAPLPAAPAASECTVRDTTGMITLVICPPGLGAADLELAGRAACDGRDPCLAWIWDDPAAVPAEAPETSEELGGEALAAALAVWVQDYRQLITMEQPYIGIGSEDIDEDLGADDLLLPPLD